MPADFARLDGAQGVMGADSSRIMRPQGVILPH